MCDFRCILVFVTVVPCVFGQEVADCYGAGSVAGAAVGAFLAALLLVAAVFYLRKLYWKSRKGRRNNRNEIALRERNINEIALRERNINEIGLRERNINEIGLRERNLALAYYYTKQAEKIDEEIQLLKRELQNTDDIDDLRSAVGK